MQGSGVGQKHLDVGLLAQWSSGPEGSRKLLDQRVSAKSKLAAMSQSVVRRLSEVQLLVISRGESRLHELSSGPKSTPAQISFVPFFYLWDLNKVLQTSLGLSNNSAGTLEIALGVTESINVTGHRAWHRVSTQEMFSKSLHVVAPNNQQFP